MSEWKAYGVKCIQMVLESGDRVTAGGGPCCSSIFAFGTIFSEPVQNVWTSTKFFWTSTKVFELVQFCFCLGTFDPYPPSSLQLHSTYLSHLLFPPCSPNIPAPILFISMLTLRALNHRPLVFLWIHVLMPNTIEPWRPGCKFPYFFKYIYTIVVIRFLKLIHSSGNAFP